jgi:hypothetical protein
MYIPINWHVCTIMYYTDVGEQNKPPRQLYHDKILHRKKLKFFISRIYTTRIQFFDLK